MQTENDIKKQLELFRERVKAENIHLYDQWELIGAIKALEWVINENTKSIQL